ncbi:protein of unknown function [Bradyrhizobium sp. ORS 285]|nr:hypothetical protein BRAO285_180022 [Bradyrhizobium sp. ORS 285]SMX61020.1 protein of unknown function [Bradyrhizobium sp. ORS 285]
MPVRRNQAFKLYIQNMIKEARQSVRQSRELLKGSKPDIFLGRKTQESLCKEGKELDQPN